MKRGGIHRTLEWEDRIYQIVGLILLALPFFGVTYETLSKAIDNLSSSGVVSGLVPPLVYTGVVVGGILVVRSYVRRMVARRPERQKTVAQTLSVIRVLVFGFLTTAYAFLGIVEAVEYQFLTPAGAVFDSILLFSSICGVAFTADIIRSKDHDSHAPSWFFYLLTAPVVFIVAVGIAVQLGIL